MNSRLYRLSAGFLGGFVLISLASHASGILHPVLSWSLWPAAWAGVVGMTSLQVDMSGPVPLAIAGILTLLLIGSMTRRHLKSRSSVASASSRRTAGTTLLRSKERYVARARKNASLGAGIRQAVGTCSRE